MTEVDLDDLGNGLSNAVRVELEWLRSENQRLKRKVVTLQTELRQAASVTKLLTPTEMTSRRVASCECCGKQIVTADGKQPRRYCSQACKQKAYRTRKKTKHDAGLGSRQCSSGIEGRVCL